MLLVTGCAGERTVAPAPAGQAVAAAEQAPQSESGMAAPSEGETVAGHVETSADDDDRMICRTFMPTGSHRKKTVCRSVGEIRRDRRSAQDALRRSRSGTAVAPGDL